MKQLVVSGDNKRHRADELFRDKSGNICYAAKCLRCTKECKQSFKAIIIECPIYERKW